MLPKCTLSGYGLWAVLVCVMLMVEEVGCAGLHVSKKDAVASHMGTKTSKPSKQQQPITISDSNDE